MRSYRSPGAYCPAPGIAAGDMRRVNLSSETSRRRRLLSVSSTSYRAEVLFHRGCLFSYIACSTRPISRDWRSTARIPTSARIRFNILKPPSPSSQTPERGQTRYPAWQTRNFSSATSSSSASLLQPSSERPALSTDPSGVVSSHLVLLQAQDGTPRREKGQEFHKTQDCPQASGASAACLGTGDETRPDEQTRPRLTAPSR